MHTFWQDLRYSLRMFRASPAFTLAALLCIGLGAGATTAIFSVVHAVVLRPLPYRDPDRLVRVYTEFPNFPKGGLRRFWTSPPEFLELQRDMKSWEALEAYSIGGANLAGGNEPMRVTSAAVSDGMIKTLGVSPILGRTIDPPEDTSGGPLVVVLSYGLWQRAFGGDRNIIGRTVQVNGRNTSVIGVMPAGFQFPPGEIDPPEMWAPLQLRGADLRNRRGNHFLSLVGRLRGGVSISQARQELTQIMDLGTKLATPNFHSFNKENHTLVSYPLHEEVVGGVKTAMLMLLAAVGFVLLIGCVNVANLLLARAEARQREIAVRVALGAARTRLVRQFITEGLVLAATGAAIGLLLGYGSLRLIVTAGAQSIPRASEVGLDTTVLLVTLGVSLLTGLFFGIAPLAQVTGRNLHEALKAAAGRSTATLGAQFFRRLLVVGELALALVLLIGTGLMIRAFWKLQDVHTGFRPEGLLTLRIALPAAVYTSNDSAWQFWQRAQEKLALIPGVTAATMAGGLPPTRPINANDTEIEGLVRKEGGPINNIDYWQFAGARFFETMGIRVLEGRVFDERDGEGGTQSIVINQTLARIYYPDSSAIGRRIRPGFRDPWRIVIGVVEDVKNAGLDRPTGTELFLPVSQTRPTNPPRFGYLVLRTAGDPEKLIGAARAAVREIDPGLPISAIRTMEEVVGAARARPKFLAMLLSMFSTVALGLAAVGIYGVISYSVARRTNEFGIRMAMGASQRDVLGMVLWQGLQLGLVGVTVGALGAWGLTRLISGLLFGVGALDPAAFVSMITLLLAVTLFACWAPARRATQVDPMVALRYE